MSQGGVILPGGRILSKGILPERGLAIRPVPEEQGTKKKTLVDALPDGIASPLRANVTPSLLPRGHSRFGLAALGILAIGGVTLAVPPVDVLAFHAPLDLGHDAPVEQLQRPVTLTRASPPRELTRLVQEHPREAIARVGTYKDKPYAKGIIESVAQREPDAVLYHAPEFRDQPYAPEVIHQAITQALAKTPWYVLHYSDAFRDQPYAAAAVKQAAHLAVEHTPWAVLTYTNRFQDQPYAAEVVRTAAYRAAEKDPAGVLILMYSNAFKDQPYAAALIQQAAEQVVDVYPDIILRIAPWMNGQPRAKALVQRAVEVAMTQKKYDNIILEYADRFAKEPYAEQAITMAAEREPFFALAMGHLFAGQPYAGGVIYKAVHSAFAQQNRGALLAYVRLVNQMHDQPDEIRFAAVKDATAHDLYTLMVLGEEEIFTSSFNGFFNRFLTAMTAEHLQGDQFLEQVISSPPRSLKQIAIQGDQSAGPAMFRPFIKLCAGYNRLTDFLQTMPPDARTAVLTRFVKGIDREREPLAQAVAVADVFGIVRDPKMLKVFQDTIRAELERVRQENNKTGTVLYGLLSRLINDPAGSNDRGSANLDSTFTLQNLGSISAKELFSAEGVQVQQHFFYNDRDGQNSFESFLAQYREDPAWTIESQDTFVRIHTSRNGRQIEIFANRPDHERDGQHAIDKIFADRHVKPAMVVHRGHSYHALNTISRIRDGTRIVYLGSCGSYNNVAAVLNASPAAHILSTKSTGTMLVNDPLLKLINEEMLSHDALQWGTVWGDAEAKLGNNPNFRNYVPPQNNLGVLFLKAYHHQMSKTGG